jgi:UDPglucose--hexose-1-phosphate uridylyltransferase
MAKMMKHIVMKLNEEKIPYNMFLHQSITDKDEHFYIRICPRRSTWAGVELGSRIIINTVSPEEAAEFYRK